MFAPVSSSLRMKHRLYSIYCAKTIARHCIAYGRNWPRLLSISRPTPRAPEIQHHCTRKELASGFLAGANFLPATGALIGLQNLFAQADGLRRDFHELIVSDEFDSLFEAQFTMRNQADSFIRAR